MKLTLKRFSKEIITISLLLLMLSSFLFLIKLTEEVFTEKLVPNFDSLIADWVYSFRTPFLNDFMNIVTSIGSLPVVFTVFCILIIIFVIVKRKRYILPLIVTVLGNGIFVELVKLIFVRSRPIITNSLVVETSFSYPSGHTLIAIALFGLIVIYVWKEYKSKFVRLLSLFIGILLILLIGFSRIYLGAHWPSDVLASYLIGLVWLSFLLLCFINKSELIKGFYQLRDKINKNSSSSMH
ncbi:MAG: phosphatase PAP2 family protein [bacterium]